MSIRRISFCAIGLVIAVLAWRDAAIVYWLSSTPDNAFAFLQSDERFGMVRLDGALTSDKPIEPAEVRHVVAVAKASLASDPLNPKALRQIALGERLLGEPHFKQHLILAERVSRRDFQTELSLIGATSAVNDYRGALRRIDAAVMTRHDSRDILFSAIAATLPDPSFRDDLLRYSGRAWFPAFIARALREPGAAIPVNTAMLLLDKRMRLPAQDVVVIRPLIWRLAASGNLATARELAVKFGPIPQSALDRFGVNPAMANPDFIPVTWRIAADGSMQTKLLPNGMIEVEAEPGISTVLAERMTQLTAGRYTLAQRASSSAPASIHLNWSLICGPVGVSLPTTWQGDVPIGENPSTGKAEVVIPDDCPIQLWRLSLIVDDQQLSTRFQVGDFALYRM
jgi:hypothetical protein